MRQAYPHLGSAGECAAGDQRRGGQCCFDGHARAEAESESGHSGGQVLVTGMDQNQGAKFMRDGEEPVQTRVGQLGTADLRADLDAEESPMAHAPAHLVDGPVGVLQGDGAQRTEAGWVLAGDPGEELVLSPREFGRPGRRRLVAECHRNRRKHLHGNAFTVHVNEPGIW
ncbi:MAG: hypothetical protein JWR32_5179 [Mycobacterium sp.]|nr:hypothetical protein [Mycobacterium sp.]